jgi:hypothetical protein
MSDLHTELVRQEMEENGELDFIRSHVEAANLNADETAAPAQEADTVETQEPVVEEIEEETTLPESVAAEAEVAPEANELTQEEEDILYLELDDDTQALLDTKYAGDINAMLRAAREGQSLIGRQGNELGAVRAELEALRRDVTQGLAAAQPYPEWPDEFADPADAAAQYRLIAEAAFARGDVQTFQTALGQWEETDSLSAGMYSDLKQMQINQAQAAEQARSSQPDETATLNAGVQEIRTQYPQLADPTFQAAVNAELDKTPSLKAVLWQGVPGVTVQERLTILREAAERVAARTVSETAQQARRRIAVQVSEEGRARRAEAQTLRADKARQEEVEVQERKVSLGESGRVLDINRLNAMLAEEDRV